MKNKYDDDFEDLDINDRDLRAKERHWRHMMSLRLMKMKLEFDQDQMHRDGIPSGWHGIEDKYPVNPKKKRITAAFDEDVVKFFKATGAGYQAKMNEVLRVYMYARLSKYIEAQEDRDLEGRLL